MGCFIDESTQNRSRIDPFGRCILPEYQIPIPRRTRQKPMISCQEFS
ncbi:hypothetical protein SAMN05216387_101290 [Nitrosovibrio tenuis]|uniref:Uncharacterized protein n=1 Tax=Nitrosovibrio tenuis TaxID=1233 RepID=A0A1H7GIS1_9PROT|nr:hypothetical protein SAMN05216387_101290 [Nitrosovibrio tenuis]